MQDSRQRADLVRAPLLERIAFRGHPLVRALHPTTIEITTEEHLTANGDCIIGVRAEKGCSQLDESVKAAIRDANSRVIVRVVVGSESYAIAAKGDPRLPLAHPHDIVLRRSDFISDRTLAVGATAAARDLPRRMIAKLRSPDAVGFLEVEVR